MSTEAKKQETTKEPARQARDKNAVETNVYRLSLRTPYRQSIFISKIIMKKHGSVQLESVGAATSEASRVAQTLVKHGYAKIKSINTEQFVPGREERGRFQIKLIIVLEKAADFDKLTETLVIKP